MHQYHRKPVMQDIIIRHATINDAAEIANVHINSWREAYRGIFSDNFLNNLSLFYKTRYELWKKVTVKKDQLTFVAESKDNGIIGFINGAGGRDEDLKQCAEVWSFYLLEKYHHQKIGFTLLTHFFDAQHACGFNKAYVWVLADNPSISFYEKTGATFSGKTALNDIGSDAGGEKVIEQCYIWDDITL
jgi:GNAT superfamily N-acetyltransferase